MYTPGCSCTFPPSSEFRPASIHTSSYYTSYYLFEGASPATGFHSQLYFYFFFFFFFFLVLFLIRLLFFSILYIIFYLSSSSFSSPPPPLPFLLPLSCDDSVKSISLPLLFTVITILIYLLTFAITLAFPVDTFATLLD